MEKRIAKVNISSAVGTAAKSSETCKVTLPTAWINALGVTKEQREMELSFNGDTIILSRYLTGTEFVEQKRAQGHDIRILRFYDNDKLCTTLYTDFTEQTLTVQNHVSDPVKTAFGNNLLPSWSDFQEFLEERCLPRQRSGLREYLETIGLDEYDPFAIIQKTAGRMAEDQQWLEVEVLK